MNEGISIEFINYIKNHLYILIIGFLLKDIAITFVKSLWLRNSLTISDGGLYKIGDVQGRLIKFSFLFGITLKEKDGILHKIPMAVAVNSVISDLDKLSKKKGE
jgi:hypothetical protein